MEWFKTSAVGGLIMIALLISQHLNAASMASRDNAQVANTSCEWSLIGGKRLLHCDSGETLARLQHRETLVNQEVKIEKAKRLKLKQREVEQPQKKANDLVPHVQEEMMRVVSPDESKSERAIAATDLPEIAVPQPALLKAIHKSETNQTASSGYELATHVPVDLATKQFTKTSNDQILEQQPGPVIAPKVLDEVAVEIARKDAAKPQPKGFMVVGKDDVQRFIEMLEDGTVPANEVDYMRLRKAPFAGRVSFGIFNHMATAEVRREELLVYGIDSVIVDRSSSIKDAIAKLD